jgi:hypothetical protein
MTTAIETPRARTLDMKLDRVWLRNLPRAEQALQGGTQQHAASAHRP